MNFGVLELALSALAGAAVGFLSGVFGVGGGFLLVPVLNIGLQIPIEFAVGAGVCQVLGPATTSLLARRIGLKNLRLPLTIAGGLFVGVLTGAYVFELTKHRGTILLGARPVPLAEIVVLVTYLLLLLAVGVFALWEARSSRAGRELVSGSLAGHQRGGLSRKPRQRRFTLRVGFLRPQADAGLAGWQIPPFADFPEFDGRQTSITILSWFGLCVGFLAGLLGMSGGLVLLPGLIYLLGMRTRRAVRCSLVIVWMVALQATIVHAWHENIDLTLVMALLVGGTIGARLGSELSERTGGRQLRKGFGWLLIGTAVIIGGRLAGLMWSG